MGATTLEQTRSAFPWCFRPVVWGLVGLVLAGAVTLHSLWYIPQITESPDVPVSTAIINDLYFKVDRHTYSPAEVASLTEMKALKSEDYVADYDYDYDYAAAPAPASAHHGHVHGAAAPASGYDYAPASVAASRGAAHQHHSHADYVAAPSPATGDYDYDYYASDYQFPRPTYEAYTEGYIQYVYLIYCAPFFVVGAAAIVLQVVAPPPVSVYRANNRVRALFNLPVPPLRFWWKWFDGLSAGELLLYFLLVVPKVATLKYKIDQGRSFWDAGYVATVHTLTSFDRNQFWLEQIGLWFAQDFYMTAPLLFFPVARGSLLNVYFGVKYGTMVKWHRWIGAWVMLDAFMHGTLYHALWLSDSASLWVEQALDFKYFRFVSNLAGVLSWLALVPMAITLLPILRRRIYWLFYHVHVGAALIFVVFATLHVPVDYHYLMPSLVVYGVDVAYRLVQTTKSVRARVSKHGDIVTVAIPLEGDVPYADGSHVWLAVPAIGPLLYHPLSIASTSADPSFSQTLLLHCKTYDKWTKKLANLVEATPLGTPIAVRVQGPFDGHTMTQVERGAYSCMLFVSGGIGVTGVLPAVLRLAQLRQNELAAQTKGSTARIRLLHSCRTADEILLVAPLLPFAGAIDISIHYTGPTKDLRNTEAGLHMLDSPADAALKGAPNAGEVGPQPSPGSTSHAVSSRRLLSSQSGGLPLLSVKSSLWEQLFVWVMAFAVGYWVLVMSRLWFSTIPVQAGVVRSVDLNDRRLKEAGICVAALALHVPLVPLVAIGMWRGLRRCAHVCCASANVASRSSSASCASCPPLPGRVAVVVDDRGTAYLRLQNASAAVSVRSGRADVAGAVRDAYGAAAGDSGTGVLGVWAAGPQPLNHTCASCVRALGVTAKARFFPCTFQL